MQKMTSNSNGNSVLDKLEQPDALELAYRNEPERFKVELTEALLAYPDSETLKVWHARLYFTAQSSLTQSSFVFLLGMCLVATLLVKLPAYLEIEGDWYYPRFVPLIVFSALIIYFQKAALNLRIARFIGVSLVVYFVYLLLLPFDESSDSIIMALLHLPLVCCSLLALSFTSGEWRSTDARLSFIRYIGEMGIYTVLILLGGMVLTGITFGLFSVIDLDIMPWYSEYVIVMGLVSAPLVATYLFDTKLNRQSKFAPILANVFSPLFLITILAYLFASFLQGNSPFTDRDFLINFNGLLILILALTVFSICGKKRSEEVQVADYINILLLIATLLVNIIALSAIVFRWAEYGMTLNRIVVTGANLLIFVHLILLLKKYVVCLSKNQGFARLESTVASYLPVYTCWALIVAVLLPLIFQFE